MTSTEFTVGLNGTRVSSKVLKPPGGGSSDIFGRGSAQVSASNGTANDRVKNLESSSNTQNRLFGITSEPTTTPVRSQVKSNIFESNQVPKSATKRYVRRNPITGEEIEFNPENYQKVEKNGTEETDNNVQTTSEQNGETTGEQNGQTTSEQNNEEEKKTEILRKPVQTSIRVRNPPGGKSSGIF